MWPFRKKSGSSYRHGERVRIVGGPFAGKEGHVVGTREGGAKVDVTVELRNRAVTIELSPKDAMPTRLLCAGGCQHGNMVSARAASSDRRKSASLVAEVHLITGKRLEVHGKAGQVFYMGQSKATRYDPYWYEHTGGRTYKETAKEVVQAIMRHAGVEAIEKARVYDQ